MLVETLLLSLGGGVGLFFAEMGVAIVTRIHPEDLPQGTTANPHAMIPEISQLHEMDPQLPFAQPRAIDEIVEQETGSQRFTTALLGLFATVGLALTAAVERPNCPRFMRQLAQNHMISS